MGDEEIFADDSLNEYGTYSYIELVEAFTDDDIIQRQIDSERNERASIYRHGKPGLPMLSRAQVRAVLGPLLEAAKAVMSETTCADCCGRETAAIDAYHAAARAILGLPADAKSPLEDHHE